MSHFSPYAEIKVDNTGSVKEIPNIKNNFRKIYALENGLKCTDSAE